MKNLIKGIDSIRTMINKPRRQNIILQNRVTWNTLCSSLDTIEDTSHAIGEYISLSNNNYSTGFSYVIVYGVMQAMFLQQDAVIHIASSLGNNLALDDELKKIREIRNSSTGHPVRDRGDNKSFNYIQHCGMTHLKFRLVSYCPNKSDPTFSDIDILKLIDKQKEIISKYINDLILFLEKEEKTHKEEFMNTKLKAYFSHFNYNIGKVYECISNIDYKQLSLINLNEIVSNIEKAKSELNKRSLLGNVPGIEYNLEEINYPINKLQSYFNDEIKLHDKEIKILIYFIHKKTEELIRMFEEIDNDYCE
ncbi:MAG: hypothetical protein HZC28_05170 [Spirochaetes bacterium]|nr:hypothetical protein [Spirochaetota bacterium]